jgi:hypothetical protein
VGIVGCRRYNSYIYTECVGNYSTEGGEGWNGSQVLVNTIENVAIQYRKHGDEVMRTDGHASTDTSRYKTLHPVDVLVSTVANWMGG